MARKKIKVQAAHTYADRFEEVAQSLKEAGMTVQEEITPLGHFQGLADAGDIERLKALPGIASVNVIGEEGEEERDEYSISGEESS